MKYQLVNSSKNYLYNELLYNSFCGLPASWIMRNYKVNHRENLLYPDVAFYKQQQYLLTLSGQILAGMSFNLNFQKEFQLEKMGFSIPKRNKQLSCEVLNFFVLDIPNRNSFYIGKANIELSHWILSKNKLKTIFATCLQRILPIYSRFGWEKIDELVMENDKILNLIKYSL